MQSQELRWPLTVFITVAVLSLLTQASNVVGGLILAMIGVSAVLASELITNVTAGIPTLVEELAKLLMYIAMSLIGYKVLLMFNFPSDIIAGVFALSSIICSLWYFYLVAQEKKSSIVNKI